MRLRPLFALVVVSACTPPAAPVTVPTHPIICDDTLGRALREINDLRGQGKLELALQKAVSAESLCDPFVDEQRVAQLEILEELGDDEQAQALARKIVQAQGTSGVLVRRAQEVLASPVRPKTRADLRGADELRAKGENDAARDAYVQALSSSPRDPIALSSLAEIEAARGDMAASRKLYAKAVRAAGGVARAGVLSVSASRGPLTQGWLLPDRREASLHYRLSAPNGRFVTGLLGPKAAFTKDNVLVWGDGRPMSLLSADGRDVHEIGITDATEVALPLGDTATVVPVRTKASLFAVDLTTGAARGPQPAKGEGMQLAGPTRLFVGKQAFQFPELSPLYSLGSEDETPKDETSTYASSADIRVNPTVITQIVHRSAGKGRRQFLIVRRTDDGTVVLEKEIAGDEGSPIVEIHRSGKYVGWLGESVANAETQGGIVDVATKKVTSFAYRGVYKVAPAAVRITADGKNACVFNGQWAPSRKVFGKRTHCWSRDHEAVMLDATKTPGYDDQSEGSLSPDGKYAVFTEKEDTKRLMFNVAVRVVEVATGKTTHRSIVGKTKEWTADAVFVTNNVVRYTLATESVDIDATTGARVPTPPDAIEPDFDVLDNVSVTEPEPVLRESSQLAVVGGALAIQFSPAQKSAARSLVSCWSTDLRKTSPEACTPSKKNEVTVQAGLATLPKETLPIKLSLPISAARGVLSTVGGTDTVIVAEGGVVRYFARTGELIGTVAAIGPERLVAFTADGGFEIFGDTGKTTELPICVIGDVVMPIDACLYRGQDEGIFLRKFGVPK